MDKQKCTHIYLATAMKHSEKLGYKISAGVVKYKRPHKDTVARIVIEDRKTDCEVAYTVFLQILNTLPRNIDIVVHTCDTHIIKLLEMYTAWFFKPMSLKKYKYLDILIAIFKRLEHINIEVEKGPSKIVTTCRRKAKDSVKYRELEACVRNY